MRAMFRTVYAAASAYAAAPGLDGSKEKSRPFKVSKGVLQGDITLLLYFILALELLLKSHDTVTNKGVVFGALRVHTLGYADDAALLDNNLAVATARVTAIAQGSREDADMQKGLP